MHWFEYEPQEITRWWYVQFDWCEQFDDVEITAHVWRDGSIYGDWKCRRCDGDNSSDTIGNVDDLVDHDAKEGK